MCLSNVVPDASLTMNRQGWSLSSLMISQIWTIRQFSRGVMGSVRRQICPIRGPRCNDSVHFPRRPKVGMYSFRNCSNSSWKGFQRDNFDVVRFNSCKLLGPKTPHFLKLEIALEKCSDCITRTRIRSASCLSTMISTIRFVVCSFLVYQSLNSCSPVFDRAYGKRALPNPNSSLQFQFTIIRNPARVYEAR